MVYESDFYTTRRPYSSRPYVSSYSVSVRQIPHLPYCAHRKLVSIVHSPVRIYHSGTYLPIKLHSRVRPSVIAAELNRIRYLTRPSYVSHTEKYLNSKDYIDFDDETREIRAKTDNLLRRIHTFVPRPPISDYDETSPERLRSDDYVRRIINAKHLRKDIEDLPWYTTPQKRDIGAGHLACIKYTGGRPASKRRPYFTVGDLVPGDVRSDVNMMSYYVKNRKAAEDAYPTPIVVQRTEHPRENRYVPPQSAPSPTVTWADEMVQEQVEPKEEPMEQEVESKPIEKKSTPEEEAVEYDEDGVKKKPDDDTIRKVQEYLEKKAADKKLEEERRAWEAAERKRIAEEKELARLAEIKQEEDRRLAEIKENERLEAERQAILQKAEDARQEAIRLAEDEKLLNEAVAQAIADEEERAAQQLAQEAEEIKKEEQVEKDLVQSVAPAPEEDNEVSIADHVSSEEHSLHAEAELSDRENEEKPYEVDHDEDTQIEEIEQEEPEEEVDNPFTSTGEAASSLPLDDEPVMETLKVKQSGGAGGEQGFDWSDIENEVGEEETNQAPPVQEEAPATEQQVFENSDVEDQVDVASCHEEQVEVTQEEVHEEEVQETTETREEEEVQESVEAQEVVEEEEVGPVREEEQETRQENEDDGEVTITEIHDEEENVQAAEHIEEVKSEEEMSEEEEEEEEE